MKKIVFLLMIAFVCTDMRAQETECFAFATSIGTGIVMSVPASTPFSWQVLGYYHVTNRFSVGVGTGLSFFEKVLIPLFADVKFTVIKSRRVTPYLECGVGYGFASDKNTNGGFYLNPSVGGQYSLCGDKKVFLALGYEWQELERLKRQEQLLFTTEFAEKLSHKSISLRLGFVF